MSLAYTHLINKKLLKGLIAGSIIVMFLLPSKSKKIAVGVICFALLVLLSHYLNDRKTKGVDHDNTPPNKSD